MNEIQCCKSLEDVIHASSAQFPNTTCTSGKKQYAYIPLRRMIFAISDNLKTEKHSLQREWHPWKAGSENWRALASQEIRREKDPS
jgi:hypothetical protein